ncbi:MAG: PrgI family protein [Candidatus Altiarchaeales archaeon]|nr:PrgI family protein [Candidatus Altiarchaeales archaeon]
MPYKIPTEIRYEERLLGPLTIKQSIYAAIATAGILFVMFLSGLEFHFQLIISLAIAGIAIGFIMFDLENYLKNYIYFMKQDTEVSWISPAAKRLMGVKAIKGDAVFLSNSKVVGVINVTPMNFGVLNKEDQDTVIYGFLQFVNSLDFPIQICMKSVNLDLDSYLSEIRRRILQRDDKMAMAYFEHFSKYLGDYISENKIYDRLFYIIVPGKKHWDERQVLANLESRCHDLMASLSHSGIIADRLDNKQLLKFYASYFTQVFLVEDEFLSPITMYHKVWAIHEDDKPPGQDSSSIELEKSIQMEES